MTFATLYRTWKLIWAYNAVLIYLLVRLVMLGVMASDLRFIVVGLMIAADCLCGLFMYLHHLTRQVALTRRDEAVQWLLMTGWKLISTVRPDWRSQGGVWQSLAVCWRSTYALYFRGKP